MQQPVREDPVRLPACLPGIDQCGLDNFGWSMHPAPSVLQLCEVTCPVWKRMPQHSECAKHLVNASPANA